MPAMLVDLPVELVHIVWDELETLSDRNAFIRTCQPFYFLFNSRLYRHAVSVDRPHALRWATGVGPTATMQKLVDAGADLAGDEGYSPLCHAAENGRVDMVEFILENGVDPMRTKCQKPPITSAISGGDVETIRIILQAMKKILSMEEYREELTRTAMESAIVASRTNIIDLLLEEGADINGETGVENITPLARAIYRNKHGSIEYLIDRGASTVDITLPDQVDPLYYAAACGYADLIRVLFKRNIAGRNIEALAFAASRGYEEIVRLLLDGGADPNAVGRTGQAPIYGAALRGSEGLVTMLLEAGASAETRDRALISAAERGHDNVVALLIKSGAEHITDNLGHSALSQAARSGHTLVVRRLLEGVADIKTQCNNFDELLMQASRHGHVDIVKLLLENGADPTCSDQNGYTALSIAVHLGYSRIVMALLGGGKAPVPWKRPRYLQYIDTPDSYGRTPLYFATKYGSIEIVRLLLSQGSTAIHTAAHSGHTPFSFTESQRHRKFDDAQDGVMQTIWEDLSNPEGVDIDLDCVSSASGFRRRSLTNDDCEVCYAPVSRFEAHEFVICGDCVTRGASCSGSSHGLVKTDRSVHRRDVVSRPDLSE
ncbi:ankyrin repeat-containing domain protein [Aspergillus cavernicola]|uniref:Ankyrin repeat-containing domain protein n=1 Tax=Aspergillus cavernicola TaxID=176166 RepID=A0ABR4IDD8_9EURO